jgi:hypothetical protein
LKINKKKKKSLFVQGEKISCVGNKGRKRKIKEKKEKKK